jgi:ABC-type multidrug transport system ATPase subunit
MSASLVGVDKTGVELAVERCHLSAQLKRPLEELTRLQCRLAGLAHALCGQPDILFLEDLFSDLDETEAEVIESVLEVELLERKWICAMEPEGRAARSILMMADEVIGTTGNRLVPPISPESLRSEGFWVVCQGKPNSLSTRLENLGAKVAKSPHEGVLRVHGLSGLQIFRAAKEDDTQILELSPLEGADTTGTHARSDA